MIIHIYDKMLVSDIQERFAKCFPRLKIEFYSKLHHYRKASSAEDIVDSNKKIEDIRQNHNQGNLEIKSWYTVKKVERAFKKGFGLNVLVFRKELDECIQGDTHIYTLANSSMNINTSNVNTKKYESTLL